MPERTSGNSTWPETLSAVSTGLEYTYPRPTGRCGPWR